MSSSLDCFGNSSNNLYFEEWLVQQISSGRFKDLDWIDSEQQRVFKLPWTKKDYPNWEEHHEIFREWAKYRSKQRNDPRLVLQPITTMKSNFRTMLRKCNYIQELKNFHQLGLQTGNYKVYKLLTREEVENRNAPLYRKQFKETEDSNNDIIEISSISGQVENVKMPDSQISSSWIAKSTSLSVALLEAEQIHGKRTLDEEAVEVPEPDSRAKIRKTQGTQTKDDPLSAKEMVFVTGNNDAVRSNSSTGESDYISSDVANGFNILLEAAEIESDSANETSLPLDIESWLKFNFNSSITHILDSLNIALVQLYSLQLMIKYINEDTWVGQYNELNKGYLLHSESSVKFNMRKDSKSCIPIVLPTPSKDIGKNFDTIMSNMNDGLKITLDSNSNLVLERKCSSPVFATAHFSDFGIEEFALQRHKKVVVFDYTKFLHDLDAAIKKKEHLPFSKLKVFVSVGNKCRGDIQTSKVNIGAVFVCQAAETILKLVQRFPEPS